MGSVIMQEPNGIGARRKTHNTKQLDAERVHSDLDTIILSKEEKKRGIFMVRLLSLVAFPLL